MTVKMNENQEANSTQEIEEVFNLNEYEQNDSSSDEDVVANENEEKDKNKLDLSNMELTNMDFLIKYLKCIEPGVLSNIDLSGNNLGGENVHSLC